MRIWLFFLPYCVSLFYSDFPEIQYWICWVGSLWIFLITFMGWGNPLPKDLSFPKQFMRPFIFAHILFAGYMCLTSVFYFLHYNGYYYFDIVDAPNYLQVIKIAQSQQYYLLAHAAMASGLTFRMSDFGKGHYNALPKNQSAPLFLNLTLITFVLLQFMYFLPFGSGFKQNLSMLVLLSSLLFFVWALQEKKYVFIAVLLLLGNFLLGALSGMKSATLIILLFLGAHYFSIYRWRTIILGGFALWLWFSFIPTISYVIRQQAWFGDQTATTALQNAISGIQSKTLDTRQLNWAGLVFRASEIDMFIRYIDHVPAKRGFYNFQIVDQALMGLIPRALRPDGKSIDQTAMERAIEVGIIDRRTDKTTSAKPALVADAYMSGRETAIIITFFLFGFMATRFAALCETLFGGYNFGSVLVFNSCFSIFQTGNCFENILASIFYGVITMYFLFYLFIELSILQRPRIYNVEIK